MADVAEPPAKQARLGEPPAAPASANIIVQFRTADGQLSGTQPLMQCCVTSKNAVDTSQLDSSRWNRLSP